MNHPRFILPLRHLALLSPLVAVLLAAGCASSAPPPYPGLGARASSNARTAELDGARVTAEVFSDRDRCRSYFKLPGAYASGLAILYVQVENLDSGRSLMAQHSGIQLIAGETEAGSGQTSQSTSGAQAVAITGATLGSTPLILVAASMISEASVVQENFVSKEFRDETIGPGSSTSGFAYFQLDKKTLLKSGGTVKVTLRRPLSTSEIHLQVPIPPL